MESNYIFKPQCESDLLYVMCGWGEGLYSTGSYRPQEGAYRCFIYTKQEDISVGIYREDDLLHQPHGLFTFSSWQQLFRFSHRHRSDKMKVGKWRKLVVLRMYRAEDQREILNDLNYKKTCNMKLQLGPLQDYINQRKWQRWMGEMAHDQH